MDKKSYNKLLSPELTKVNLMAAAIYLTAYEFLKSSIIEEIKNFFFIGEAYNNVGMKKHYATEVLSLDNSIFVASCTWLHNMGAITREDIQTILRLRELRHKVAHQLPEFLVDDDINIHIDDLVKMQELLTKIDSWWIREVELTTNPDYSHLDQEALGTLEVHSGNMLILGHLIALLKSAEVFPGNLSI